MFGIALFIFFFQPLTQRGILMSAECLLGFSRISFFIFSPITQCTFDEGEEIPGTDLLDDFKQMFSLIAKLLVIIFILAAFYLLW